VAAGGGGRSARVGILTVGIDHPRPERNSMEFILGLLHLILFIWALVSILGSSASGMAKLLWSLVVLIFPLIGLIIWFFAGPKKG
jgi:hypothetical protein